MFLESLAQSQAVLVNKIAGVLALMKMKSKNGTLMTRMVTGLKMMTKAPLPAVPQERQAINLRKNLDSSETYLSKKIKKRTLTLYQILLRLPILD